MPKQIIRVKRPATGLGDKKAKVTFRAWLDEQPRTKLTYAKDLLTPHGTYGGGWTVSDFILEAHKRGINHNLHWGTVFGWARGQQPRQLWLDEIREVFPDIKF